MTKLMIVEDDTSLREIYSIRLTAEGYDVSTAGDGEEALAVAVREKPDIIVADVMMPKISGFDMLDILKSTPETSRIKVIIMTALSSDDQRARGESLGADRYLVKSQVGIEDVVRTVHEVLGDKVVEQPANQPEPASSVVQPQIREIQPQVIQSTWQSQGATTQTPWQTQASSQQTPVNNSDNNGIQTNFPNSAQ